MRFWEVDWVLKEADKFPGGNHLFWKISKGTLLILGGKKPLPHPNSWRRKVVQVLYRKVGGVFQCSNKKND